MNLQEKTLMLMGLRGRIDKIKEFMNTKLEPLQASKQALEDEIKVEMTDTGQMSARFQTATISLAVRKSITVTDSGKLIKDLQKQGLEKEYLELQPNALFKNAVKETIKTGKLFKGTEIVESQYLSLRKPDDEKKDRRKVTTD